MVIDIVLLYGLGHGGVENVITKIYNGLKKRGHRVRVFQSVPPYYKKWAEGFDEIYYFDDEGLWYNRNELDKYINSYNILLSNLGFPDIVIATHYNVASYLCKVALGNIEKKIPIISWIHGPAWIYGEESLLNYSDAHFAISSMVAQTIYSNTKNKNIFLIGNPVDVNGAKIINSPNNKLEILLISRIEQEKNLELLFNALSNVSGDWHVTVIGDGSAKDGLINLCNNLGILDKTLWLGWREEPWKYVINASVTVICSKYEGFSLSTAESLAHGIPVISSRCGGPEDMIQDGVNGWLYDIDDIDRLSEILKNIINNVYVLPSNSICINSIEKYSEDSVIERIEKLLLSYVEIFKNRLF